MASTFKQPQSKDKKQRTKDKFYTLAKEHGYRARSAYKLVQLEKKYGFLGQARIILDLCAAPGSWCQVARKYAPVSSVVLGTDLLVIPPIAGVKTFVGDITKVSDTMKSIKDCLGGSVKEWGVDVVLNDGAPSMGTAWLQDAFSQLGLALSALNIAASCLTKGGWFITKAFRSSDYNALYWVCSQFFAKVEATKPAASRNVSAEMYLVCKGFLAPKKVDQRLFDPEHVFATLSSSEKAADVLSTKYQKALAGKRKIRMRDGYADDAFTGILSIASSVLEFIDSRSPGVVLGKSNSLDFVLKSESELSKVHEDPASTATDGVVSDSDLLRVYQAHPATTDEIRTLLADVKVLSKGDLIRLAKWRDKMQKAKDLLVKMKLEAERGDDGVDEEEVKEDEEDSDDELNAMLSLAERRDRRRKRKRLALRRKLRDRIAMGMKIVNDVPLDDGVAEQEGLFQLVKGLVDDEELGELARDGVGAEHGVSEDVIDTIRVLNEREARRAAIKQRMRAERGLEPFIKPEPKAASGDGSGSGSGSGSEDSDDDEDDMVDEDISYGSDDNGDLMKDLDNMYAQYKEAAKQRKVRNRISTLKKRSSWMRLTGAHGADEDEEDRDAYDKGADTAAGDIMQTLESETRLKKQESAAAAGWYARGGFKDLDVGDDLLDGLGGDSDGDSSSELSDDADADRIMREDVEGRQDWADRMAFKAKRREERAKIVAQEEKKAEKKKGALALVTVPQTELGDVHERLNSAVVKKTTPGRGPAALKPTEEVEQPRNDDEELDSDTLSDSADSTDDASDLSEERARVFAAAHSAVNKKRKRSELRDVAFSRYAYADDVKSLPSWFIDDEASRLKDPLQVTEEEVKAAREFYNRNLVRGTVNKAAEAAFRKKRKISRRLAQLKEKASDLAVDETADRAEKAVEMEALLKNARRLTKTNTSKREKRYIVSKRGGGGHNAEQTGGGGGNHKIVAVDKRLKADKRARKTRNKKAKKGKRR
eukprot:CAMPEP_0170757060 /NCGR_PEP_ID=MMETSP0437-20130122/14341_1 /TAXON_ID=0 /ORGANISM="Sexangularia sp." /LENGTH=991 /DNA_ID=CAMNT_0011096253 /DNA_START=93 /DNA_END=3068 /DNA_ORIENTATION=-